MKDFCVDTIRREPQLRGNHGILRAASFAVTNDARLAAERIEQKALAEADVIRQRAQEDADAIVKQAEQQTLERAAGLIRALQEAQAGLLERSEDIIVSLAQAMFDRLIAETTPRERIEAMLRRVQQEAPQGLVNPLLRLHPEDLADAPAVEWPIKPDPALPRGTCRLEASEGEWTADFCAAVSSLKSALQLAAESGEGSGSIGQEDEAHTSSGPDTALPHG